MALVLAALALFGAAAEATVLHQPPATATAVLPLDGITPLETPAPDLRRAKARRGVDSTTVFLAPDNTCGYVDGKQNVLFSCNDAFAQCAITSNLGTGYIGCCDAGSCGGYHTSCIDREAYDASGCGDACNDAQMLLCTNTGGAFCNTITINADAFNVWAYYCAANAATEIENVETTYSGETDGRRFTRTVVYETHTDSTTSTATADSDTDTAGAPTDSGTATGTTTDASTAPTTTPTTTPTSTATTVPVVPATPAAGSPTPSPAPKKKSNTGAIAGGVVGGVVGAALLAGLAALLLRQHKKSAAAKEAAAVGGAAGGGAVGGAAGGPPVGPSPPPMTQPGGYAAVPQQPPYFSGQAPAPSTGYPYYGGAAAVEAPAGDVVAPVATGSPAPDRTDSTSPLQPSPTPASQDYSRMSTVSAASSSPFVGGAAPAGSPAPVPPTIYEAGGSPVGADGGFHHGTMHELA